MEQQIVLSTDNRPFGSSESAIVTATYATDPLDETLNALGFRVHFDSNQLTFNEVTQFFDSPALQNPPDVFDDTEDFDGDPTTDRFLLVLYLDQQGQFPGEGTLGEAGLEILTAEFTTAGNFSGTMLNVTSTTTGGQGFETLVAPGLAIAAAENQQQISLNADNQRISNGETVAVTATYTTDPLDETLNALGFRVHFDSTQLTFNEVTQFFDSPALQENPLILDDTENFDGDPTTDRFLLVLYLDQQGQFPGEDSLPLDILTANFTAASNFTGTNLNVTSTTLGGQGYETLIAPSLELSAGDVPAQILSAIAPETAAAGSAIEVVFNYTTDPLDETLNALGFRVHFDSTQLTFNEVTQLFDSPALQGEPLVLDDTEDFDSDPTTDRFLLVLYLDQQGQFPGEGTLGETGLELLTAEFTTASDFSGTMLNVTSTTTGGQGFETLAAPGVAIALGEDENTAPVVENAIADIAVAEDADPIEIELADAFGDAEDGDNLTFSTTNSNENLLATAIADGRLTLTLTSNAFGSAEIVVTATDSEGLAIEESFAVTVEAVNDLPEFADFPSEIQVAENAAAGEGIVAIAATDIETAPAELSVEILSGNEGEAFAIATGTDGSTSLVVNEPEAIDFEAQDNFSLELQVSDADGGVATETIAIAVTDDPSDNPSEEPVLDADGSEDATAFNDGLIIFRFLAGLSASTFAGAISADSSRSVEEIETSLTAARDSGLLDVDGSGDATAFNDGLIIFRFLAGLDASTFEGALSQDATRDLTAVSDFLEGLL